MQIVQIFPYLKNKIVTKYFKLWSFKCFKNIKRLYNL